MLCAHAGWGRRLILVADERGFYFSDGMEPTFIPLAEAYEWWPCLFNS